MAPGYGTTNNNNALADGTAHRVSSEEDPLLGKNKQTGLSRRLNKQLKQNVHKDWADLILLGGYVITGLLDSCSVSVWGSFVSMQTGNTIYLGVGLVDPMGSTRWLRSGISVAFFCIGSFFFARFHRYFSPKRRWVLIASTLLQMAMIVAAAIISMYDTTTELAWQWQVLVPLALVAFQSAGQAVISRAIQYNALTSVVLTSIYCDLFSDAKLFAGLTENAERNRRSAAPLLLLVGAMCGSLFAKSSVGIAGALWTAVALKALVCVAWYMWRAEPEADEA